MQLNSYEFILILLPVTLLCYFTLGRINVTVRKLILCASGAALFAYAGWKGFAIFVCSIVVNFVLAEMMLEANWVRKVCVVLSVFVNIALLLVFKYADFAITTVNSALGKEIDLLNLALPLGISFFTFQQIAYSVKVSKGEIKEVNLLDYLTYILYFPKLIMGPIVDPVDLIGQFNDPEIRKWNAENFVSGVKMFSFGLFKKMVLADTFALAVSWGAENMAASTSLDRILIMLCYTFQIYFDFSGYSDMAIGVSDMFNIRLPMNFDSPYKALSVRDFWNRWHISLTKFLTNYIYIPLGGSRKGKLRTYINVLIVFTVSGIWHGSNWTFILWGVLYGLLSVADRIIEPVWNKIFKPIRWLITFCIVNVMWLLFSAESINSWIDVLKKIVLDRTFTISSGLAACFRGVEMPFIENLLHLDSVSAVTSGPVWMIFFLAASLLLCLVFKNNYKLQKNYNLIFMILAALAFAWSFLFLGSESVFIYNNF